MVDKCIRDNLKSKCEGCNENCGLNCLKNEERPKKWEKFG